MYYIAVLFGEVFLGKIVNSSICRSGDLRAGPEWGAEGVWGGEFGASLLGASFRREP